METFYANNVDPLQVLKYQRNLGNVSKIHSKKQLLYTTPSPFLHLDTLDT